MHSRGKLEIKECYVSNLQVNPSYTRTLFTISLDNFFYVRKHHCRRALISLP